MNKRVDPVTASTGKLVLTPGTTASTAVSVVATPAAAKDKRPRRDRAIQHAVYAYIRARRALGHTRVNSLEIAEALGINPGRVHEVLDSLRARGVKVVK
jgi:hypothetical protein